MFTSNFVQIIVVFALALLPACKKSSKPASGKKQPRSSATGYNLGEVVHFGRDGNSVKYKRGGWGDTEKDRTWTNANSAVLRFTLPDENDPLRLQMKLAGLTNPPAIPYQPVEVYVNDERVADWQVSEPADFFAIIPKRLAKRERLIIELRMPQAASPKALGIGEDARTLGVCCFGLAITKTSAALAEQARAEREMDPLAGYNNAYSLGTVIYMGAGAGGQRYKAGGWHTAEKNFTWTGGDPAVLQLSIRPTERPLKLRMRLEGMIEPDILPAQPTQVMVNGEKVADWLVAEAAEFEAIIPAKVAGESGELTIALRARGATSPKELKLGDGTRPLGVRCEAVVIEEAPFDPGNEQPEPSLTRDR